MRLMIVALTIAACSKSEDHVRQLVALSDTGEEIAKQMTTMPSSTLDACKGKWPAGRIAYYQAATAGEGAWSPGKRLFARVVGVPGKLIHTPGKSTDQFDPTALQGLAVGKFFNTSNPFVSGSSMLEGKATVWIRVVSLPAKQTLCDGVVTVGMDGAMLPSSNDSAANDELARLWERKQEGEPWEALCTAGAPGTCID